MQRKSKRQQHAENETSDSDVAQTPGSAASVGEADAVEPQTVSEDGGDGLAGGAGAIVEPSDQAVSRLRDELEAVKDRHLRMAAEYDNFRKRTARERSETWNRAQADVVANLLDALDDLGRVSDLDPEQATSADVIKGVELVERKFIRELEGAGLERVGTPGEAFDPNVHEAIGSLPAENEEQDHTVGAVLQIGYRFGGALLRPAKVQVRMWQGGGNQD